MNYQHHFNQIRNYLAGRTIGITHDKSLLDEVVKCFFCKKLISQKKVESNNEEIIAKNYRETFQRVKKKYSSSFDHDEEILLDPGSIYFIDGILEQIITENRGGDPISDLYQTFVGNEMRGSEGQFFTPHNAVEWIINAIDPKKGEKVIDPACGTGTFLYKTAEYLLTKKVSPELLSKTIYGIDKDMYLTKLANIHLSILTGVEANVYCGDSVERIGQDGNTIPINFENSFDIVVANPPFGSKIKIGSTSAKQRFDLAKIWSFDPKKDTFMMTDKIIKNPSPQILFLEVCIKLLKKNGRLGIVLPESMISNSSTSYVVNYLMENTDINAVVGMPENLFKTSGKGGTHTKTCLILANKKNTNIRRKYIFMSEVKWCGNDSRGREILKNDLPEVLGLFKKSLKLDKIPKSSLGHMVNYKDVKNYVLAPRYYNPEPEKYLKKLSKTHHLLQISDLIENGVLEVSSGHEIGKLSYGTGKIPFVRTSDIANWEVKLDPKQGISEEIYNQYSKKQDIRENDILMVRDGTYLIGTCALITKYDTKILYQSHLLKIRVNKPEVISPFILLASLSSPPVLSQIQSKRFTQDIIDSIGARIVELVIPIPKDKRLLERIDNMVKKSINDRVESREMARQAKIEISKV